jgi:cyclase
MCSNQTKHNSMEKKMYYKASPLLFEMAKELRNNVTNAEMLLWSYLRTKPEGFKFRRQHPMGILLPTFIVIV